MRSARMSLAIFAITGLVWLAGCGDGDVASPPPRTPTPPMGQPQRGPAAKVEDALGSRPRLESPRPFEPPAPQTWKGQGGITVWLLERHTLPLVSVTLSIPVGSARDPE